MNIRTPGVLLAALLFAATAHADSTPVSIAIWGSLGSGAGQFDHPFGIAIDGSDFVYVSDQHNNRIQKFTAEGRYVLEWSTIRLRDASHPTGITVAPNGDILVTEHQQHVVSRWSNVGAFLGTIGQPGYETEGHLAYPVGVATDAAGNVYVGDSENHRVQKFASDGTWLMLWGSRGVAPGQFDMPYDVEFDGRRLWVSEYGGSRYQAFDTEGNFLEQVGSPGDGDGQFYGSEGSCFAGSRLMFACDTGHDRIQVFRDGAWLLSFGERGERPNQLYTPSDIAVNSRGEIFVVEWNNHRIQKFRVPGEIDGAPTPAIEMTWGTIKDRYRR